ncbi:hypothetical protein HNR33_003376 [Brassicibacter mesophilus]
MALTILFGAFLWIKRCSSRLCVVIISLGRKVTLFTCLQEGGGDYCQVFLMKKN